MNYHGEFEFREAQTADLDLLVKLRIEFLINNWGPQSVENIQVLQKHLKEHFNHAFKENTLIGILVETNQIVVGVGMLSISERPGTFTNPSGKTGYILNMYTRNEFRKKGIARQIFKKLISLGKDRGISAFELHATKDGYPLYIQEGFNKPHLENLVHYN